MSAALKPEVVAQAFHDACVAELDALKPGRDLVALQHAFDAADEAKQD